jgi:hypothetical protein
LLAGRLTFAEILEYHDPTKGDFTLLRISHDDIAGAACFSVRREDLYVDYLARNALFESERPVRAGSVLIAAVELVAERLGRSHVRLESVNDPATLEWYRLLGFVPLGAPRDEPGWGTVHPMEKRVGSLGGAGP